MIDHMDECDDSDKAVKEPGQGARRAYGRGMLVGLGAERASAARLDENGSLEEAGWYTEGLVLVGESFPEGSSSACRVDKSGSLRVWEGKCDGNIKNGSVWMS